MKNKITIISFLIIVSCNSSPQKKSIKDQLIEKSEKPKIEFDNKDPNIISRAVIDTIFQYYLNEFPDDSFVIEDSDTTLGISFYQKSSSEDSFSLPQITVYISKLKKDYISGDLNGNGLNDLITIIPYEWGASSSSQDIFTLINENNFYHLKSIDSPTDICGCDTTGTDYSGLFYPAKIESGKLIGTSECWTKDDARCCPSQRFTTIVSFKNGKLVFERKTYVGMIHY